jgi:metal-responsive CopG/Arc/MetJ family transcriptional regulator
MALTMAKKSKKTRLSALAKGHTQMISISLPGDLVNRIDKMAAAQNRNRSNFIAVVMKNVVESR